MPRWVDNEFIAEIAKIPPSFQQSVPKPSVPDGVPALVVRALFHWLTGSRVKVNSRSPASSRLSATPLHWAAICG